MNNFEKKKLLMKLIADDINTNILYLINEVRTSPEKFSDHLLYLDSSDKHIKYLSYLLKYSSSKVPPLFLDKNLSMCSKDLLTHLISIDKGYLSLEYSEEEKMKNSLTERLKRLNMKPGRYNSFIIVGAENSFEAIVNMLSNEYYRNAILSQGMHLIGIASGLLPSDNLCIIIDIVKEIKVNTNNINYIRVRRNVFKNNRNPNYHENNNELDNNKFINRTYYPQNNKTSIKIYKKNFPLSCYNTIKKNNNSNIKINNMKRVFNSNATNSYFSHNKYSKKYCKTNKSYDNKIDSGIDLRIKRQKSAYFKPKYYNNNNLNIISNKSTEFMLPINIYIDKQYIKKNGKLVPIYTKETTYNDGSVLIQPNVDGYDY